MKEVWALAEQALKQAIAVPAKPILKWAGGKTQMLGICFRKCRPPMEDI